jgi:capping protein alpha
LGQYWGGEWQSQWTVDTQNCSLSGSIRVNNHYFENGNIQFNLSKNFDPVTLTATDGPGICF